MAASARAREKVTESRSLEEQIRRRAYEIYMARGGQGGSAETDWLQAEAEVQTPAPQETQKAGRKTGTQRGTA